MMTNRLLLVKLDVFTTGADCGPVVGTSATALMRGVTAGGVVAVGAVGVVVCVERPFTETPATVALPTDPAMTPALEARFPVTLVATEPAEASVAPATWPLSVGAEPLCTVEAVTEVAGKLSVVACNVGTPWPEVGRVPTPEATAPFDRYPVTVPVILPPALIVPKT